MSDNALKLYENAEVAQAIRNQARHIRTKINDARGNREDAAARWPFELLQNALDTGAREGREGVEVVLCRENGSFVFEHDGAFFRVQELAALLSGGSSKEFDATDTTGRFGTGFLVTHVLAPRAQLQGLLHVEGDRIESFDLCIDRSGDEDAIMKNITRCKADIRRAKVAPSPDGLPSARFVYADEDLTTLEEGIAAFEKALPYLFVTCPQLGRVRLGLTDDWQTWEPSPVTITERGSVIVRERIVAIREGGRRLKVVGVADPKSGALAAVVLEETSSGWDIVLPAPDFPRVFCRYPIRSSHFLPINVILDARFDVDQERRRVHLDKEDVRALFHASIQAVVPLLELAYEEGWRGRHWLARVAPVHASFSGREGEERDWLNEELHGLADQLARKALVETAQGSGCAVKGSDGAWYADFVVPRLNEESESDDTSADRMWELMADVTELYPPIAELTRDWTEIANGWAALGVAVKRVNLSRLGEYVRDHVENLEALPVRCEPRDWLARFLCLVGECWVKRGITKGLLQRLLPDQHGRLRSAGDLRRDGGVGDRVKSIAAGVGLDIGAQLLDQQLVQTLKEQDLEAGLVAVRETTGNELTEDEAVRDLVRHIADALPDEKGVSEENRNVAAASITLLEYLWNSQGEHARKMAWEVPLLAADGTARRAGHRRLMVPPVPTWPETAQAFAEAYPPSRVLAVDYAAAADAETLLEALADWGIAHRHLLEVGQREELRDRGLRAIAADPEEVTGAVLRGTELMQIALLEPEIINYCKQSRERARALLGLVVRYVAPQDQSWRSTLETHVQTPEGEKQVHLTPSLWLADLRSKPWIPVEGEEDVTHHLPNPKLLSELIAPEWLEDNRDGVDLLVRHFDMDELDMRLLAAAKDEEERQQLRDRLARIVELAGNNPKVIEDFAVKAEQRKRDVEQMRSLGLAVQEAVKAALERCGLKVEDVDRGYDFLVTAISVREDVPEDLSAYFEVGEYKVEVKATTTNEARLTPLQAATAVSDPQSFVLCVVDLRGFDGDVHKVDWTTADVSSRCRLVSGGNLPVRETLTLVLDAEGQSVPIRNSTALRYAVGAGLWERGLDLDQWVRDAFTPGP